MRPPFDALRETLLRAGYSPWRVGRYCRELSDHYADLVADELAAGRALPEAQAAARARLGSDEALAAAMLMRPSLRTWTAKAPFAVVVLAPITLLVAACIATVTVLMSSLGSHPGVFPAALQDQLTNICGFENFQLPVLVSALIGLWTARNRLRARWAVLGVLAVAVISPALRLHILWPGHNPADPTSWAIEGAPASMWLQRFREVGLLDLIVGLAIYWAAAGGSGPGELAAEAPTRPGLRRWAGAPWASLVLFPVVLMVLASVLLAAGLTAWLGPHPAPSRQLWSRLGWLYTNFHALPALTTIGVALAAARQRAAVIWPVLGLLAIAFAGAALHLHLLKPGDGWSDSTPWDLEVGVPVTSIWRRFSEVGPLYLMVGMALYWTVRVGSAPAPRLARA
jgi:hypothetical protein